jgi:LuxR family transcriptional regulator, maltose regulon positive regulatory protein
MSEEPADVAGPSRPLVWSKLQAPVQRRRVHRPGLLELCSGSPRKLTLIRAPAGWGKSTLLAEWHAAQADTRRFAWLALDRGDNDPVRFWSYLIEALRSQHPQVGAASLALLEAPRVDVVRDVLPVLSAELSMLPGQTVLVLDDYHVVTSPEIDDSLAFFVDHLPRDLELAVASRTEPPLPLARLRGRGELVEIDAGDLGFSVEDAEHLFNDLHGLGLRHGAVARLQERTEGWAAGLYLASLTLRGRGDPEEFIAAFAGDDRQVVDYLSAEVMAGQPDEIRSFLLRTSLLDRLSAALCDAVTGRSDSRQVLRELETSNFFLIPLDTKREWYRYHHLFAELLRHELRLAEPHEISGLHRRASSWHREFGSPSDAIAHATAAGDFPEASELILEHWVESRDQAHWETILSWLGSLPPDVVRGDPRLCLVRATTLQEMGRLDEATRWLDLAERAEGLDHLTAGPDSAASGVAACRAIGQYFLGDVGGIRATAAPFLVPGPPRAGYWNSALLTTLGAALFALGRTGDSAHTLEQAARFARDSGHTLALIHALGWSAVVHLENGEPDHARRSLLGINAVLDRHAGLSAYFGTAMAHIARGTMDAHEGRLDRAEKELSRGNELAQRGEASFEQVYGLVAQARVAIRRGDRSAAKDLLGRARRAVDSCVDAGALPGLVSRTQQALQGMPGVRRSPDTERLSDRELVVLRLLQGDLTQRELAAALQVSVNTVKSQTKSIFRKLGATTRQEAVGRARETGLL